LAIRPNRLEEGAAYFPCAFKFNFACELLDASDGDIDAGFIPQAEAEGDVDLLDEKSIAERNPKLTLPKIQIVKNISQYNFEFERQTCPQGIRNCGGGSWIPNYSSSGNYGGCGLNSCDSGFSGYISGYNGYGYSNSNPFMNSIGSTFGTNGCNSCGGNGYNGYNGCNNCGGGGGGGFNYNYNYDYGNYGNRGGNRGRRRGYDYYDYDDYDYDYDYGYRGRGGGRNRGRGRPGIINVDGTGGGAGGGGTRRGGGATGQKPGALTNSDKFNPYLSLLLGKK